MATLPLTMTTKFNGRIEVFNHRLIECYTRDELLAIIGYVQLNSRFWEREIEPAITPGMVAAYSPMAGRFYWHEVNEYSTDDLITIVKYIINERQQRDVEHQRRLDFAHRMYHRGSFLGRLLRRLKGLIHG